jgi:phage/plasmid-associated DNA primase
MLDELKQQQRELTRKIEEERQRNLEKALNDFVDLIIDDRTPLEIKKEVYVESYKSKINSIFAK